MTREPFIAHSELTNEIYIVTNKEKYRVTEQVIKAVKATKALEQEPCEDAVSRQAVLDLFKTFWRCFVSRADEEIFKKEIKDLPSVNPQEPFDIDQYCKEHFVVMVDKDLWEKAEKALKQEPKTGHWVLDGSDNSLECISCGCVIYANDIMRGEPHYCPNCGAKMESES